VARRARAARAAGDQHEREEGHQPPPGQQGPSPYRHTRWKPGGWWRATGCARTSYVTVESNPTLELQLFFDRAGPRPAAPAA
jgi:hypothetical protein